VSTQAPLGFLDQLPQRDACRRLELNFVELGTAGPRNLLRGQCIGLLTAQKRQSYFIGCDMRALLTVHAMANICVWLARWVSDSTA
jgi:hypothetical protein